MRLSEAILLGSTMLKPKAGTLANQFGTSGCALGMACKAVGVAPEKLQAFADIMTVFPWTIRTLGRRESICQDAVSCTVAQGIAHFFDAHVMGTVGHPSCTGDKRTLEELIDWVRSIEPPEKPADAAVTREREAEAVEDVQCGQADPVESR